MPRHTHSFVEEYDGLVGFGFDRKGDGNAPTYYLQKFSDDECMALMREGMSQGDMEELFDLLTRLLKSCLAEEEYHKVFLKEGK